MAKKRLKVPCGGSPVVLEQFFLYVGQVGFFFFCLVRLHKYVGDVIHTPANGVGLFH